MDIVIPETKVRMPKRGSSGSFNYTRDFSDFRSKNEENLVFQWKKTIEGKKAGSDRLSDYKDYP